jgi:hypothetical protein
MWRDMMLVAHTNGNPGTISKTAAALNHWLMYERNDLPMEITRVSFAAYNHSITSDGTLPVKMFGRKLNLKRLAEKKIKWLICYGLQDDLVEPATALAPLKHVDAQVTPFPKGHVAIATSWSYPESAYALHKRYEKEDAVGPVRFQLDLQAQRDTSKQRPSSSRSSRRSAKADTEAVGKTKAKKASPSKSKPEAEPVASKKRSAKVKTDKQTPTSHR